MFCIKPWLQKLQCGIARNVMPTNKVTFNPFRLCNHNFQYLSIQFHMFKFDIVVVLFAITFHKAFILTFTNYNSRLLWTKAWFNGFSTSLPGQHVVHVISKKLGSKFRILLLVLRKSSAQTTTLAFPPYKYIGKYSKV